MPSHVEEISVLECYAKFEAMKELLEDDINEEIPSQSEFQNVSENYSAFKDFYLDVIVSQQKYKVVYVPGQITEAEFNSPDSLYKYNDNWRINVKQIFKSVNKAVVTFLHNWDPLVDSAKVQKNNTAVVQEISRLLDKIKLECKHVTATLDSTFKKLNSLTEINPSQSQVYSCFQQQLVAVVDEKIPSLFSTLNQLEGSQQEQEIKTAYSDFLAFENKEKIRLYQLIQLVADKTVCGSPSVRPILSSKVEAIHLKKVDPPQFSGQETDYPDFFRKWNAIVGPANLPQEAEIDRLRDSLPLHARDMLVGVTKVSKAWEILNKRFGDKDFIATKLKGELKTLKISEKLDFEKVIALVIKVRSLVSRLETLGASETLKYDIEFLSAIYFQLPERQRYKWLEFEKSSYDDKWTALMAYLDIAYEQSVQEKLLLASYSSSWYGHVKKKNPLIGAFAAGLNGSNSDDQKLEAAKQRVGKCPLCNEEHTFKSKWRTVPWPSDRLIQCRKFNEMDHMERCEALDFVQGCTR